MGYEIKMIIGQAGSEDNEIEQDRKRPIADGGFAYVRNEDGSYKQTGRKEHWFSAYVTIDLCKLGYQDDALNRLIKQSHETATERNSERVYYFYGSDGNARIERDCYDSAMWPVPVADVLAAMKKSWKKGAYRRTDWAMALLASMVNDTEKLEVLFYGH